MYLQRGHDSRPYYPVFFPFYLVDLLFRFLHDSLDWCTGLISGRWLMVTAKGLYWRWAWQLDPVRGVFCVLYLFSTLWRLRYQK